MKILNDFADLLAKTPEAIWGVLIGSLLTLFGSWIANRHSRVLQNQQLDFERTERARERAHQLRREVYLVAAESMTRVISTLSRSVDPLFSNELLEQETAAVAQSISKVQMVGSDETIRRAAEFSRAVTTEVFYLLQARLPMQTLQFDVNLAEQWRDRYQADINRALEEMRAYNLDGVHNPPRWAVIQRQAEFATEQREIFETQRNEASKKLLADRLKLTRAYFDRIVPVMRLGAKALLALRAELEFDRPSTVLLDELEATIESMKNETEDIHSALSQKFREMKIID